MQREQPNSHWHWQTIQHRAKSHKPRLEGSGRSFEKAAWAHVTREAVKPLSSEDFKTWLDPASVCDHPTSSRRSDSKPPDFPPDSPSQPALQWFEYPFCTVSSLTPLFSYRFHTVFHILLLLSFQVVQCKLFYRNKGEAMSKSPAQPSNLSPSTQTILFLSHWERHF